MLRRSAFVLAALCTIASSSMIVGCQSPKDEARSNLRTSAVYFRQNLGKIPGQVDATMARLNDLGMVSPPPPADAQRRFSEELAKLRVLARETDVQADHVAANASDFFREWVRESSHLDSAARADAEARIASGQINLNEAKSYVETARQHFRRLLDQLVDIEQTAASSSQPNSAIQSKIGPAVHQSTLFKATVERLTEQLDQSLAARR